MQLLLLMASCSAGGKDSNGNTVTTKGYNTAYSVCPKGWRLPTATTSNADSSINGNWKTGDMYALLTAYGANLENDYYEDTSTFYKNAGPGTVPNFLTGGYYWDSAFKAGGSGRSTGDYLSSTSYGGSYANVMHFYDGYADSADITRLRSGESVRCMLRDS